MVRPTGSESEISYLCHFARGIRGVRLDEDVKIPRKTRRPVKRQCTAINDHAFSRPVSLHPRRDAAGYGFTSPRIWRPLPASPTLSMYT